MVELKSRILLLIYKTLLVDYGVTATKRVFEKDTLILNGKIIENVELYEMIFLDKLPPLPFEYVIGIYQNVEDFLNENSLSKVTFMENLLHKRTKAFLVANAQEALKSVEPYISELFNNKDPRFFILKTANYMHKAQVKSSSMKVISTIPDEIPENRVISLVEIVYSVSEYYKYSYNIEMWKAFIIKGTPLSVGAPPFDTVQVRADCRSLDKILKLGEYYTKGNNVYINDIIIGVLQTYEEFITQLKNELDGKIHIELDSVEGDLSTIGVTTLCNYGETDGDYPLLRKGCFYGAPSYLMQVEFTQCDCSAERPLQHVLNSDNSTEDPSELIFIQRHNEVMAWAKEKLDIVYYKSAQKIFVNGKLFGSRLPAVLLYYLCAEYSNGRNTAYGYQELVLSDIFKTLLDPYKPNIDVRIHRLKKKLKDELPLFEIKTLRNGYFQFISHSNFKLTVQ